MNAIYLIAAAIYAVLCILIFIKFWGFCNDVRELKNHFLNKKE